MGNSNKSSLRKAQSVPDTQRLPPDAPVFMKVSKSQSQQRLNQSLGKASGSKLGKLHKDKGHSKSLVEGIPQLAPAEAAFLPDFPLRGDLEELDFEVIDVIAKGAYGNVIKVQREDSKRFYAMKVLDKQQIIQEGAIRQCKDEAAIQSMAGDHPLVVKAYEYWQSHLNLYIVLDYIPHGDMFTLWTFHGAFPEALVQLYIAEMSMVIDYLHNSSVIYRDVKMENILFDQKGHIQLTDFGLAKWLQGGEQTRTVCGTLQYMAPEVLSVYPYSHSADWWSLGILMYAMLAGRYPVDGADTHTRMAQKVFDCDYLLPSNVSDAAQDVINRILTKSPHKRLGDMYNLQDLGFFQDIFFPDLLDKKISPIDVVPPDFFPMTGESWAPHLLTEEERRNFDLFDGVNSRHRDSEHGTTYHKDHKHRQYSSTSNPPRSHQVYKYKNNSILRQQSTPEQLNYEQNSFDDGKATDWNQEVSDNGKKHRSDYRQLDQNRPPYKEEKSRNQDYSNYPYHTQTPYQYQQPFENVTRSSSEADNLSHRSSTNEMLRRRSQDLISYPEPSRSAVFSEWERDSEKNKAPRSQHNIVTPTSHYSGNHTKTSADSSSNTAISPSAAYKTVEAPPTVTLKAPTSYSSHKGSLDYSSNHSRTKHNLYNQRFSNQAFGYLGPGPPYNVDPSSASNGSKFSDTGANSQRQMQSSVLESEPYSPSSKPAMEYKTVEAPPTITLPTASSNSGPPPVAARRNTFGQVQPDNSMVPNQFSGPVLTPVKQYNTPPPVPAKPVVPPKPQAPVRPQPAPRRSLQGRSPQATSNSHPSYTSMLPSSFSTAATPSSAYVFSPEECNSNRSFVQRAPVEPLSFIQHVSGASANSYASPGQENFTTDMQPFQLAGPSTSGLNSSFDQGNFIPSYSHSQETYPRDNGVEGVPSHFNNSNSENRYSDGSQGSLRSPTLQSNFKWKLPANVAPSFV